MNRIRSFSNLLVPAFFLLVLTGSQISCKKYLDAKNDKSYTIASTLQDVQALTDYYIIWNRFNTSVTDVSDDNYFLVDNYFNSLPLTTATNGFDARNLHAWSQQVNTNFIWTNLYENIYNINVALETLIKKVEMTPGNMADWKRLKGTCLFVRAYCYYFIAQLWAEPYNRSTASQRPGIPLRLDSDPNPVSVRGTLEETWQQIVRDQREACQLLPNVNTPRSRPSRAAAYAGLARTYLSMGEFELAREAADSCLSIYNTLMNYSSMTPLAPTNSFPRWDAGNTEVIFPSYYGGPGGPLNQTNWRVDTNLYKSYSNNDLRKQFFFLANGTVNGTSTYSFRGDYEGRDNTENFTGLATDEVYLIRAECRARLNDKTGAINDLETLLRKRWSATATAQVELTSILAAPVTANDALVLILKERRKELISRGMRWYDLRRLNLEPPFATTIERKFLTLGLTYTLPPNDPRYTFYIPQTVIDLTGMQQNVR